MWSLSERWNDGEKMHEREIEPGPEHLFWWCRRNEYKNNKKRVKEKLIEKKNESKDCRQCSWLIRLLVWINKQLTSGKVFSVFFHLDWMKSMMTFFFSFYGIHFDLKMWRLNSIIIKCSICKLMSTNFNWKLLQWTNSWDYSENLIRKDHPQKLLDCFCRHS